ncbi:MAG TPA: hypothetical protein VMS31_03125 [Pyrinomonadaceae bacterium]|nr:hypothetical protein [Pyrinomonadaceae bacterium]
MTSIGHASEQTAPALQRSEERFRLIVDSIPGFVSGFEDQTTQYKETHHPVS